MNVEPQGTGDNADNPQSLPPQAPSPTLQPRIKVFISYCHADMKTKDRSGKSYLDVFREHLRPLLSKGLIELWDDSQIIPGEPWFDRIKNAVAESKVAVLMVSAAFLNSDFIIEEELGPLLKGAEDGGVKLLWILLRACAYKGTAIGCLQPAFPPDKPLAKMGVSERDEAWVKIVEAIKKALEE